MIENYERTFDTFSNTFTNYEIRNVVFSNRIVFPAVATGYANPDGSASERLKRFYESMAGSGAGMIILGATAVAENGSIVKNCSRIDRDEHIDGTKELLDIIKKASSVAGIQLNHGGRQTTKFRTGGVPTVAPSAIRCPVNGEMPRELSLGEIKSLEADFVEAAQRAAKAGADYIEFHGARGYLINQFLSPFSNKRSDKYGGSLENRARFALNIVKKARQLVGDQVILGFRMTAMEFVENGFTLEETIRLASWLKDAGIDMINLLVGIAADKLEDRERAREDGLLEQAAATIKKEVQIPIIGGGGIASLDQAESIVQAGSLDFAAICRALIADPFFIEKSLDKRSGKIVACLNCRKCLGSIMDENGDGLKCQQNTDLP